jgi:hypothetical protein
LQDQVSEAAPSELEPEKEHPGIAALITQLGDDARSFASSEMRWIKAEAGERAGHIAPALVLLIAAASLGAGSLIALLIGLILLLQDALGLGGAVAAVVAGGLVLAGLLGWLGGRRLKRIVRPLDGG